MVREDVIAHGVSAGLGPERGEELALAVHEVSVNSLEHGSGHGVLRIWHEDDALICEVHDQGRIADPMVGPATPRGMTSAAGGCGWPTSSATWSRCAPGTPAPRSGSILAVDSRTNRPAVRLRDVDLVHPPVTRLTVGSHKARS